MVGLKMVKRPNLIIGLDLHFHPDDRNAIIYLQFNVINFWIRKVVLHLDEAESKCFIIEHLTCFFKSLNLSLFFEVN